MEEAEAAAAAEEEAAARLDEAMAAAAAAVPVWRREPWEVTRQRNLVRNDMALALVVQGRHGAALELLDLAVASEAELAMGPTERGGRRRAGGVLPEEEEEKGKGSEEGEEGASEIGEARGSNAVDAQAVDARFLVNRGDCHRALGRLGEALADFENEHYQE